MGRNRVAGISSLIPSYPNHCMSVAISIGVWIKYVDRGRYSSSTGFLKMTVQENFARQHSGKHGCSEKR